MAHEAVIEPHRRLVAFVITRNANERFDMGAGFSVHFPSPLVAASAAIVSSQLFTDRLSALAAASTATQRAAGKRMLRAMRVSAGIPYSS